MFNIKLDYSNIKNIKVDNQDIPFFNEISLIDFICTMLYKKQVKFILSDDNCSDYGMDCKFDLPCLLEVYDDTICSLLNRQDFSLEFYEQGREYVISFVIFEDNVKLNIRHGYDNGWSEEELTYCYVKKMFVDFYGLLFENLKKYCSNITENLIFNEWNTKLSKLK